MNSQIASRIDGDQAGRLVFYVPYDDPRMLDRKHPHWLSRGVISESFLWRPKCNSWPHSRRWYLWRWPYCDWDCARLYFARQKFEQNRVRPCGRGAWHSMHFNCGRVSMGGPTISRI